MSNYPDKPMDFLSKPTSAGTGTATNSTVPNPKDPFGPHITQATPIKKGMIGHQQTNLFQKDSNKTSTGSMITKHLVDLNSNGTNNTGNMSFMGQKNSQLPDPRLPSSFIANSSANKPVSQGGYLGGGQGGNQGQQGVQQGQPGVQQGQQGQGSVGIFR